MIPAVTDEDDARATCLATIVDQLQQRSIGRLVIESRQDDLEDQRLIGRVRLAEPRLVFEHRVGLGEPMLWVTDAITWAVGAGGPWRGQIDRVLQNVIELRP